MKEKTRDWNLKNKKRKKHEREREEDTVDEQQGSVPPLKQQLKERHRGIRPKEDGYGFVCYKWESGSDPLEYKISPVPYRLRDLPVDIQSPLRKTMMKMERESGGTPCVCYVEILGISSYSFPGQKRMHLISEVTTHWEIPKQFNSFHDWFPGIGENKHPIQNKTPSLEKFQELSQLYDIPVPLLLESMEVFLISYDLPPP